MAAVDFSAIDLEMLQRYDLTLIVNFNRYDRCWHGLVRPNEGGEGIEYADQDRAVAIRKAISDYIVAKQPKAFGAADAPLT